MKFSALRCRLPILSLALAGACALLLSARREPIAATVTLSGPSALAVDDVVDFVAQGTPPGGTYTFQVDPLASGASASASGSRRLLAASEKVRFWTIGSRLRVRGLLPSDDLDDLGVSVVYRKDGATARAELRFTVVDGDVQAFRPQHGSGYAPLPRRAVAEADEEDPDFGPGIRINQPGELDPAGEDDLIEILVDVVPVGAPFRLRRDTSAVRLWNTRNRAAGTEILFSNDVTPALTAGGRRKLWVEWAAPVHGLGSLKLEPDVTGSPGGSNGSLDRLLFHTFQGIVIALGGEGQVPSVPVDPNHGSFLVGVEAYESGFDVFLYDEDNVSASGAGAVYDEVETAIDVRRVSDVAVFGYSHGGGSTYDLSDRLDANRATLGPFVIPFTSYVDSVENDSNFDVDMELRLPPSTQLHVNHYQRGSFIDAFLDGGPVPGSIPAPSGLDVETTVWGAGATHFIVDDYSQVLDRILTNLNQSVRR